MTATPTPDAVSASDIAYMESVLESRANLDATFIGLIESLKSAADGMFRDNLMVISMYRRLLADHENLQHVLDQSLEDELPKPRGKAIRFHGKKPFRGETERLRAVELKTGDLCDLLRLIWERCPVSQRPGVQRVAQEVLTMAEYALANDAEANGRAGEAR